MIVALTWYGLESEMPSGYYSAAGKKENTSDFLKKIVC